MVSLRVKALKLGCGRINARLPRARQDPMLYHRHPIATAHAYLTASRPNHGYPFQDALPNFLGYLLPTSILPCLAHFFHETEEM